MIAMKTIFPRLGAAGRPAAAFLLLLGAGCAHFDAARARREQTDAFTRDLARLAAGELGRPLSLDDCIRIALRHNYDVRQADLRKELARIGKNVAFTAFLPNVAATAGYTSYTDQPNPMTEKRFSDGSLNIGLPILMPSTWFLYQAAQHGFASAEVAAMYVRQGIVVQTTQAYFDVLVRRDTVAALETQAAAARATAARMAGLAREGFFAEWEADQARYLAEAREVELHSARRQLGLARGTLLVKMGLSPAATLAVSGAIGEAAPPPGDTAARVLKALEAHPSLALADRRVVAQNASVRQAFCAFLPTISIFASRTWTGNDLATQSANWMTGLKGAWTLFDGLANTARYRAARVERRQSELERESTVLSVMLQVVSAEAALADAAEAARLKQRAYEVAAAKAAEYEARAREGLVPLSEALDAQGARDLAEVALVQSRYQERMAIAGLELAMGLTLVPESTTETKATP